MAARLNLPVMGTAIASWRLLLRWPQATLLTMALAAVWMHVVLRAATLMSYTPAPLSSGPDGYRIGTLSLAVSGGFALSGWLLLAALVMVYWARAAIGGPASLRSGWRTQARAIGLSATVLAALIALWLVLVTLIGLPFGARPMMVTINMTPAEAIADQPPRWVLDWSLLLFLGACIVAAYVPVRLALGLPAIALGRAAGFRIAWPLGSGNGWRLLATLLLALVPVWLAGAIVDPPIALRGDSDWIWWIRNELDRSLNGLQFALAGVVLALCYRQLGSAEPDAENT